MSDSPRVSVASTERATPLEDLPGAGGRTPLFLHRETYRRRRVMDAARLLPFLGAALMLLPMLWEEIHATSSGAVYLFVAWFALIFASGLMARKLAEPLRKAPPDRQWEGSGSDGEGGAR